MACDGRLLPGPTAGLVGLTAPSMILGSGVGGPALMAPPGDDAGQELGLIRGVVAASEMIGYVVGI